MRRCKSKWAYYSRTDSYSKSYNAVCAEEEFRFPKSRAREKIRDELDSINIDQKKKNRLKKICYRYAEIVVGRGTAEWHHSGRYASKIDYYDFSRIRDFLNWCEEKILEKQESKK